MLNTQSIFTFHNFLGKTVFLLLMSVFIFACTIVRHDEVSKTAEGDGLEIYFVDGSFDAKEYVDNIWDQQVRPEVLKKAHPATDVYSLVASDLEAALDTYGYRQVQEGNAMNFTVQGEGSVIAVHTESRNGTLDVDIDSDEKPDIVIQIGPVFKGTSIRDSLAFIKFDDFKNQLEFAKLSNELNFKVRDVVLQSIDPASLQGKQIQFTGCFSIELEGNKVSSLTPVFFEVLSNGAGQ